MAHFQQLEFVRICKNYFPEFFKNTRVLEVGSWDINGSVRTFFSDCTYIGIDVAAGPGVDIVCSGETLDFPTSNFDVVLSCESFEHNCFWLETFINMSRVLKANGLFIMSCGAKGRIEHGTSRRNANLSLTSELGLPDYYGNLSKFDITQRICLRNHFSYWGFAEGRYYRDLYFLGIKKGSNGPNDVSERLQRAIGEARKISTPPNFSKMARQKRHFLSTTGKVLETCMGGRTYQNVAFWLNSVLKNLRT